MGNPIEENSLAGGARDFLGTLGDLANQGIGKISEVAGVDPDSQSGKLLDRLGEALDKSGDSLGKHTETALNNIQDIMNKKGQATNDDVQNYSNIGEKSQNCAKISIFTLFTISLFL